MVANKRARVIRPVDLKRISRSTKSKASRSGVTAVEFAFVSPIIFALFLGAIEFTRLNMVRNTAAIAAYEGARTAMVAGGNIDKGGKAARSVLSAVGVNKEVEVKGSIEPDFVEVEVRVPMNKNSWGVSIFTSGAVVKQKVRLQREKVAGG